MQSSVEKLTELLNRARERERTMIAKIGGALGRDAYYRTALQKRLRERQAEIMFYETELRWAKEAERLHG